MTLQAVVSAGFHFGCAISSANFIMAFWVGDEILFLYLYLWAPTIGRSVQQERLCLLLQGVKRTFRHSYVFLHSSGLPLLTIIPQFSLYFLERSHVKISYTACSWLPKSHLPLVPVTCFCTYTTGYFPVLSEEIVSYHPHRPERYSRNADVFKLAFVAKWWT